MTQKILNRLIIVINDSVKKNYQLSKLKKKLTEGENRKTN